MSVRTRIAGLALISTSAAALALAHAIAQGPALPTPDEALAAHERTHASATAALGTPPAPVPDAESSGTFGVPPFSAWVASTDVYVVPSREKSWPMLGVLRFGDRVRVTSCDPACDVPNAWVGLEPFGAVRLSHLRPMPLSDAAAHSGPDAGFRFARIGPRGADGHVAPDTASEVLDHFRPRDELVFRDEATPEGWLQRPDGLYVQASDVRELEPSPFAGWHDPPETFVFVRRDTVLTHDDGTTEPLRRYDRLPMERLLNGGRVRVQGGTVPRADVRNGRARPRPARVPEGARWIHIDLSQQVLTAYEGDRMVFATLVSTGIESGSTSVGLFQVRRKLAYTTMKSVSDPTDEYLVEGVRWVQYFTRSVALHGAYWHDRFGTVISHGCVNLSFADAEFLYGWSPGVVPEGWRAVNPDPAYGEALWVKVERIR